jgi:hypothetical protein
MAIEAPLSRYKKNNIRILIAVLLGCAVWFAYDGYFNEKFMEKHRDDEGNPDSTLAFNRKAPPVFVGAAVLAAVYLAVVRKKKIVATETELVIDGAERIPYDSIEKIDKTNLERKGYFVITCKDGKGAEFDRRLRDTTYDNLRTVLDYIVARIT